MIHIFDEYYLYFQNKIKIENIIDRDLIGGFIIKVGDIQFDNSVNSILKKLKTTLFL